MPAVETKIWNALRAHIEALSLAYPIDWPASDFNKPVVDGVPDQYVEVRNLPNTSARVMINSAGAHDRPGILMATLMVPVALKRQFEVMQEDAATIAAGFPCDHDMVFQGVRVRVEKAPDIAAPLRDDAYWRWPIAIRWRCFA